MIGQTLGHYRVVEKLGEGGMGVVYRATDTRLGRDVALKVLPDVFASDADRMARFEREARLLASLNHPNIAAIYGQEESAGVRAIVMELVDGPSLADRLRSGPIPLEESLAIAKQIAEALEAAHEKGIIHRDLKPANVKVTPDGKVKVLDFGLAKALVESSAVADLSASPTISEIVSRTGVILGTAAYMSPEQARGKPLDKRTDIWSFGCLLYEVLTGKIGFRGDTVSDTIAQILEREPDWQALPENTPPAVRRLLRRCLQKDPQRRLRDIADARLEIEETLAAPASGTLEVAPAAAVSQPAWWRSATLWMSVIICAAVVSFGVWNLKPTPPPSHGPLMRFAVTLPPTEQLGALDFPSVALSPTGTHLAFVASRGGTSQLFLRRMDSLQAELIPGTERALSPFFSPDGQWLGFFANGKLMKVSIGGGAPAILCDAPIGFGAVWGPDNTITFAPTGSSGLLQVPASGGAPREVTKLDSEKGEFSHRWPDLLPGGKTLLFTVGTGGSWDDAQIVTQSLETGERHVLIAGGTSPHYIPTGHVVYARGGSLMAVPFDLARRKATGPPTLVLPKVSESIDGAAQLSISPLGHLVYVPGGLSGRERTLVWVNRNGVVEPLAAPAHAYSDPRLSPDGRRLALTITQNSDNVWVYDIPTESFTQLTFEGNNSMPVWTPDGAKVTFTSSNAGPLNLFWKQADGRGTDERLTTSEQADAAHSWSPDGRGLVFVEYSPTTGRDIWMLSAGGELRSRPILQSPWNEAGPALSPDGRWLAYVSDESGRNEVYVRPFPGASGSSVKWQVSAEGGTEPLWSHDGSEIFYRVGNKVMAVRIRTTPSFKSNAPQLLFEGMYEKGIASRPAYDVSVDGRRFLMVKTNDKESSPTGLEIVLEWFEELKRRVPK
jgi:serine/threonine-protein kinase